MIRNDHSSYKTYTTYNTHLLRHYPHMLVICLIYSECIYILEDITETGEFQRFEHIYGEEINVVLNPITG